MATHVYIISEKRGISSAEGRFLQTNCIIETLQVNEGRMRLAGHMFAQSPFRTGPLVLSCGACNIQGTQNEEWSNKRTIISMIVPECLCPQHVQCQYVAHR